AHTHGSVEYRMARRSRVYAVGGIRCAERGAPTRRRDEPCVPRSPCGSAAGRPTGRGILAPIRAGAMAIAPCRDKLQLLLGRRLGPSLPPGPRRRIARAEGTPALKGYLHSLTS